MNKLYKYLVLLIICIVGVGFNYKQINQFPQNIHCWAQCDRYAIALGFLDNNGDFFHPQTFVYNKQFPDEFNTISNSTITSVDFPIYDYCAYLLMNLFNTTEPWCFKLFSLLYSIIGFFYLYKLTTLFTSSKFKQMLVIVFAITSPVVIYFQAGMLPSTTSLANTIIGIYFIFNYYTTNQKKHFFIGVLFLTIATLARLPFIIIIIALIATEFLTILKSKKIKWFSVFSYLISLISILSYLKYNAYLRNTYGSLFLSSLLPAKTYEELKEIVFTVYDRWLLHYFSIYHYIMIFGAILFYLINLKKIKSSLNSIDSQFIRFIIINFIGVILFFFAMAFQFLSHDYYFLDSFYLPIVLLFLFTTSKIPTFNSQKNNSIIGWLSLLIAIPMCIHAQSILTYRKTVFSPNPTAERFYNADKLLAALQIPKTAKILTINEDGPNNPLILLKRKGYSVIWPEKEKIANALNWPFDYLVLDNAKLITSIYSNYPDIKNKIVKIGGNNFISVYIKKQNNETTTVKDFLNINLLPIFHHAKISFDTILDSNTSNVDTLSNVAYSGKYAGVVTSKNEYGVTYKFKNVDISNKENTTVYITSIINAINKPKELLMSVSVSYNNKDLYFFVNDISEFCNQNNWTKHENIFIIPKINEKNCDINIFIWNKGKNTILYDDIDISIY